MTRRPARRQFVASLCALIGAPAVLGAFEKTLDPRTLDEAVTIGRSRFDADRAAFHQPYRLFPNKPPIDWIDVITPFRRVVLSAETNSLNGGRLFGQREALASLGSTPERVDIVIELTFHPMNNFVGVPAYRVRLVSEDMVLQATGTERVPRFGPRLSGTPLPYPFGGNVKLPNGSQPLLGGTIVASFDGRVMEARGVYEIVVADGDMALSRTKVDFSALR